MVMVMADGAYESDGCDAPLFPIVDVCLCHVFRSKNECWRCYLLSHSLFNVVVLVLPR